MSVELISKSERTHQAIIESAYDLFIEQGYAATSMRQIAKRSGMALGGIYYHFAGKEEIFSELLIARHPFNQILPILLNTQTGDIESFVKTATQAMLTELGKSPDFIKLMLIEMVEFNGRNMPEILAKILPQILPLVEKFEKNSRLSIPPFVFFRAFLGLIFSYYVTELLLVKTPAARTTPNALDYFVEIFLHGVMAIKEPV